VVATINEGARKGHWSFKQDNPMPIPVPVIEEVKKDEPRTEAQTKTEEKPQANVPIPPKQTTKGIVLDYVNIRKGKALNSEKILNLKPNDVVEIKKEDQEHYLVGVDGKEGYVGKKFIKVQK
jgi:flagellar motor switch protein FliM